MDTPNRTPGTRINAKITLRRPTVNGVPGAPYDLTLADNYLIYAFVRSGTSIDIIAQFSRETITGYLLPDETGLDPTAGETRIIIEGEKTKKLKDVKILLDYDVQFNDLGNSFHIGAEDGAKKELVNITYAANPEPPTV